ncbi:hypothetical protein RRF57_010491 [Xylaria bambusicola]|uniref:Uncharacterized protein n=1 Tax=Xylaria bambusicola TaxID=326684 RepID=A0AAN7ZD13_9PEZI
MQAAAREVAWANARLRELLDWKGVGREEVDGFLRRCREGEEGSGLGAVRTVSREEDGRGMVPGGIALGDEGKEAGRGMESEEGLRTVDDAERALSTSCEAAAGIIAGFLGHDVVRVRMALGCEDEEDVAKCRVKNTTLFQLME